MKHAAPAALLFVLFLAPSLRAQTRPDFSGTWTMDPSRSQSAVQNEPIRSMTLVIRHTDNDLSIDTKRDGKEMSVTYRRGTPDTLNSTANRSALLASTWYWDGPRLVTETVRDVSGATVRTKEVHALDSTGNEMTVEMLVVVEHGYTLRGAQNYGTGKDVFKKVVQ